jgi:hypothetical protein
MLGGTIAPAFLPEQSDPRLRRRQYAPHAAGIEGTLSRGVRTCGLRRARYIGAAKVHLEQLLIATALNFLRVSEWIGETPRAKTRRSPYVRLMKPSVVI